MKKSYSFLANFSLLIVMLTSGMISLQEISGGIVTWEPLPYYGTINSWIMIGSQIITLLFASIVGFVALELKSDLIKTVFDLIYGVAYILMVLYIPLGWSTTTATLVYSIGSIFGFSSFILTVPFLSRIFVQEEEVHQGISGFIARISVISIMFGTTVYILNRAGLFWVDSILSIALASLFLFLSLFAILATIIEKIKKKADPLYSAVSFTYIEHAGARFFPVASLVVSWIALWYGLELIYVLVYPSVLSQNSSDTYIILLDVIVLLVIVWQFIETRMNGKMQPIKPKKRLIIEVILFLIFGVSPILLMIFYKSPEDRRFSLLDNWILGGYCISLIGYIIYLITQNYRMVFEISRIMQLNNGPDGKKQIRVNTAYSTGIVFGLLILFGFLGFKWTRSAELFAPLLVILFIGYISGITITKPYCSEEYTKEARTHEPRI